MNVFEQDEEAAPFDEEEQDGCYCNAFRLASGSWEQERESKEGVFFEDKIPDKIEWVQHHSLRAGVSPAIASGGGSLKGSARRHPFANVMDLEKEEEDDDSEEEEEVVRVAGLAAPLGTSHEMEQQEPPASEHQEVLSANDDHETPTTKTAGGYSVYEHAVWIHRTLRAYWRNQRVACVWLILYGLVNVLAFYYKASIYAHNPQHEIPREVFGSCVVVARGAAMCLNLNAGLILIPLCRHLWTLIQTIPAIRCFACFPSSSSRRSNNNGKRIKRLHWNQFLPFDQMVLIHKVIGVAFLYWTLVHCAAHACDFYRFSIHPNEEDLLLLFPHVTDMPSDPAGRWKFLLQQPAAITGIVMVVCMLIAYPCVLLHRKLGYDVFWYSHHLLLIMLIALIFHGIGRLLEPPQSIYWVGVPLLTYLIPRFWREVADIFCQKARVQVLELTTKPGNIVVLKMTKPLAWRNRLQAGMYANLNIPSISVLQWHPFTMTSAPSDDYIEFHIRPVGDFTKVLYLVAQSISRQQAKAAASSRVGNDLQPIQEISVYSSVPTRGQERRNIPMGRSRRHPSSEEWLWDRGSSMLNLPESTSNASGATTSSASDKEGDHAVDNDSTTTTLQPQDLVVRVDGPLGAPSSGYSQHRMVLLVGAGIGIAPMISVLKELLANPGKMKRTYVIWAFRERKAMDWFASLIDEVLLRNDDHHHDDDTGASSSSDDQRRRLNQGVLQLRFFVTAPTTTTTSEARLSGSTSTGMMDHHQQKLNDGGGVASSAITMTYGTRPNWYQELTRIQHEIRALHYNKCGIFCCGPTQMTKMLRKVAFRISRQEPDFHFYCRQETFSL